MKKKILLCDFVISKNLCNAKCEYCLTKYNKYDFEDDLTKNDMIYKEGTDLHNRINNIVDSILKKFDVAALKVSGGEILLIKNIIDLLIERSSQFINVQMMTNGILINSETIMKLKRIPNFSLQISMDSNTFEGNFYRNKNIKIQERILNNIDKIIQNNIPLEINCVLTDKSIKYLVDFLDYLKIYNDYPVKIFPFPVRGGDINKYFPKDDQIQIIDKIINNYNIYEKIGPPLKYWIELKKYLFYKKRQRVCMIPFHTFQFFDNGEYTPCPYWWTVNLGNFLDSGIKVFNNFRNVPIYRMLLSNKPKLSSCTNCFIRSEVLNLYFENLLSIKDIKEIPFYAKKEMLVFVSEMKNEYLKYMEKT